MTYKVNFENVETVGLEDSPVAKQLAELRASEARYFWNKYQSEFVTMSADENPEIINRIEAILKKHNLELPYNALAVSDFAVNNVRCSYIFLIMAWRSIYKLVWINTGKNRLVLN
jgi:hypothetical protein